MRKDKHIYAISIEDIFTVAEEVLERKPTKEEVKYVEEKVGDYIDWFSAIEHALYSYPPEQGKREE